jgi:dihydrofolate reductase
MRTLKLQTQVSVDGFMAGPNSEMEWMTWNWDEELKNYVRKITEPVDTILLGRVLAEGFIPAWASQMANPETADLGAKKMVETPKIVFSKTMTESDWDNATLENGDLVEAITKLKKQKGGDIIAYGGSKFVSNLSKFGLIDEYHLFVNPAAIGSGMPVFHGLKENLALKLKKATAFECGIVVLCYEQA